MTSSLSGTTAAAIVGQAVTCQPANWPIKNAAGASSTDPGILVALTDSSGNYSFSGLNNSTSYRVNEPGHSYTGTMPASDGSYTTAGLTASSGWTES